MPPSAPTPAQRRWGNRGATARFRAEMVDWTAQAMAQSAAQPLPPARRRRVIVSDARIDSCRTLPLPALAGRRRTIRPETILGAPRTAGWEWARQRR
jgi:hypothetical protein